MANIKPLGDRVVVKRLAKEERTASGIVIPDSAKEKPAEGEVLAVGPGRLNEKGERSPMEVSVGDKVLFTKYGPSEVKVDGEELLILSESDILAIVG
ncbi:co-chaperone GroES [Candidatus Peregrinibacteria bacterium CG10_big_fil_rev_8_21_14_0_10_44_7]|nr:MAG: co-chaperone GroES [Candidatus Peregrinibacteria bacterium CG10_big_fil_rev_8_21_14_0_10_44_7]